MQIQKISHLLGYNVLEQDKQYVADYPSLVVTSNDGFKKQIGFHELEAYIRELLRYGGTLNVSVNIDSTTKTPYSIYYTLN